MARWMLQCKGCDGQFVHAQVLLTDISDHYFPCKPMLPLSPIECPYCGHKAAYLSTELL
jgi:rRNA maturation endonuclease Nob1